MNDQDKLNKIRGETLNSMARNETLFKLLLWICGASELAGMLAVLWFMDWGDPTHCLIFAATMLVWINLALWVLALAVRNRVGEQRILRAIEVLAEATDEEANQ